MCSIDWCYFQWSWVSLTAPNHPIFDIFCIAFHIFVVSGDTDFNFGRYVDSSKCQPRNGKPSLKEAWLSHVNHLNFGGHQSYDLSCRCLRFCQLRWTVSVVNWWRSRSAVYYTDRRHLCTTPWTSGTASHGSVSGSRDSCWKSLGLLHTVCTIQKVQMEI